ncbi:tyrosine-protein phosphatase non-receptor type 2 isoform X2 [Mauremys mutica]|uniref:tyrosine-protein phosphatase non-receptor type 2 isoform X2 n=1 Tax=Mauremys mutica TaxID=74926 RepID=UPI001D161004|nr:tyrosine-protein phosphatase non-receptor type 2 isoform X2 [Mauremys mutica]
MILSQELSAQRGDMRATCRCSDRKFGIKPMTILIELQNIQKTEIEIDTEMSAHSQSLTSLKVQSFKKLNEQKIVGSGIDMDKEKKSGDKYDHSRVKLQNTENDYINASLVVIEEAQRNYILTQGPLPNTCCHFWLMVWQQKTRAVVMLNRIVEKESVKCAQYWPTEEEEVMMFEETGFCVRLVSEDIKSYYTVHLLQLENINSGESRMISHYHYTTWPDFGVPESPASFLNFLFKVRESGSLSPEHGPAVIHCSAGIGRSGTFSLVDTCLVLMEKKDPSSVDIKQVLLDMRKYRMGLIQTPDQLRFSYMAVIEGAKFIMGDSTIQKRWKELSKEDQAPCSEQSPPHPTRINTEKYNGNSVSIEKQEQMGEKTNTELSTKVQDTMDGSIESTVRKRLREDRKAHTAQKVHQMKQKLSETERKRKRPRLTDI